MKRKALTIAISAALAVVAGSASAAYDFASGSYTIGNTAVIRISGSSATNAQTKAWAQNVLCDNISTTGVGSYAPDSSNNFAIVCTPKPGVVSLSAGKTQIAVIKNSTGGSGNGISQLNTAGLKYIDVFQTSFPLAPVLDASLKKSDLGVSDEEPSILVKAGAVPPSAPGTPAVTSDPLNAVTFGTPVTLGLRDALQVSQVNSGRLPPTCAVGAPTATLESEACMPSLSMSQIASIFGGQAVGWSEFGLTNTKVPVDDNIYIARRVITSGTQTASRVFFLNDPCADNMVPFVAGNLAKLGVIESTTKADACNAATASYINTVTGLPTTVFEGSGGGNVEACLTNHDRNGRWAIGINSLELPSLTDTTPEFATAGGAATGGPALFNKNYQRHIKIDGFAPTTFNTATGRYRFFFEAALNSVASISPDAAALKTAIITGFNNPAVLVPLNASFNTTALLGLGKSAGILAPTSTGVTPLNPATEANTTSTPRMYYSHNVLGTPNSCQPAMSIFPTGINP